VTAVRYLYRHIDADVADRAVEVAANMQTLQAPFTINVVVAIGRPFRTRTRGGTVLFPSGVASITITCHNVVKGVGVWGISHTYVVAGGHVEHRPDIVDTSVAGLTLNVVVAVAFPVGALTRGCTVTTCPAPHSAVTAVRYLYRHIDADVADRAVEVAANMQTPQAPFTINVVDAIGHPFRTRTIGGTVAFL
jgi:hypothetical protein